MEMELFISFVLFVLFALSVGHAIYFSSKRYNTSPGKLPPGPVPLPIIGNLLDLGEQPHKSLTKFAKIHGPLMSLQLGQITTIVISCPTLAKEIAQEHDLNFCNRNVNDAVQACQHHEFSMAWLPVSPPWRNLRKICNSYIFTSQKLDANQDLRRNKIQQLLADVQESRCVGKAVDIGEAAFKTTLNALSNTIFSLDLSNSSSDIVREFKEVVRDIMNEGGKTNLADYFPVLKKIDPQRLRHRMAIHFQKLFDVFDHLINERLQARKAPKYVPSNDLLETLLIISEANSSEMDVLCIKHLFLDLFAAGTDTTSSTLEWAMAELLRNPETLLGAKSELEQTIGKGTLLDESDVSRLPYLQAIIKETFRLHPALPFLLPRKAKENVEMCGFIIPEGAQVMINAWAIGRDPNIWKDPTSFVPERFLESDIDARGKNFKLFPFGFGRRICPGLPLAMRMLQLMLGSLINTFDWKLEDGVTPENMDMEDRFGVTLQKARPLRAIPIKM